MQLPNTSLIMTSELPYRNLPQLLLRAREAFLSRFRPIITQFGLTEQQWRIIRAVNEAGKLEPREICEICQILSPSLAGVLSRMEETGLVTRARMAEDQRRIIVRLTQKSEKLVEELAPLIVEQYELIEKSLGKELLLDVYAMMDRVLKATSTAFPPANPPEGAPRQIPAARRRMPRPTDASHLRDEPTP